MLRAPPKDAAAPSAKDALKKAVAAQKAVKAFGGLKKKEGGAGESAASKAAKAFGKPK
mgnify:CR=1 FL=1